MMTDPNGYRYCGDLWCDGHAVADQTCDDIEYPDTGEPPC